MDWKQILMLKNDSELDDDTKEAVFEQLLSEEKPKIDKSGFKKLFRLSQTILKFKGEQINSLLSELDSLAAKQGEKEAFDKTSPTLQSNELSKLVEKLEADKANYKSRIKELTDENSMWQKKVQDSASHFGASDREDSPDALSEIDRQEELYQKINMKNKHIKRLLRDIEALEKQNIEQISIINELKANLSDCTLNLTTLTLQFSESQAMITEQKESLAEHYSIVSDLREQIMCLQNDQSLREREIQSFGQKLEERAELWRKVLNEKEHEIEELKQKYQRVAEQNPGYDIDAERIELTRLTKSLEERDEIIKELESKIDKLTEEMIGTTNIFNKISASKEDNRQKGLLSAAVGKCCEENRILLEKSNGRCKDLQEILTQAEQDCCDKAKQAMEAMEALRAYENGEDGLPHALQKNQRLQVKIKSRDKQIHALIMEMNSLNEVAAENCVLRKQLGLPEDDFINTSSVLAKQRKLEKVNERLSLKLRASEEMRLQLKLDKNELKRKISSLTQKVVKLSAVALQGTSNGFEKEADSSHEEGQIDESTISEIRLCEHCCCRYEESKGESKPKVEETVRRIDLVEHEKKINEQSEKYKVVVEENENLRIGMHEILEKLREYDANSDHITIDTSTLEKLLYALDARSISGWYHPAMRMQSELMITKEREIALREQIKINGKTLAEKISSIDKDVSLEHLEPVNDAQCDQQCLEKTTEMLQLREQLAAIETKHNQLVIENDELKITERQYTDLIESLKQSDSEQEKLLIEKIEKLNEIEVNACKYKRKLQYFKMENDSVNEQVKTLQTDHLQTIFELKKELAQKNIDLQKLRSPKSGFTENGAFDKTDFQNIAAENAALRQQLSQLSSKIYKNFKQINQGVNLLDGKDADELETVVLVDDNLGTEFYSKAAFEEMKVSLSEAAEELMSLKMVKKHLEELLAVTNEQVRSQQGMLTRSSDDEIELRHMIADLQSTSNEKYLLVKKHKELDAARSSEEKLKSVIFELQAKYENLHAQFEEQTNSFQMEQELVHKAGINDSLKISYFKKTLNEFRAAYCQYTPLHHIIHFIKVYLEVFDLKNAYEHKMKTLAADNHKLEHKNLDEKVKNELNGNEVQDKINLIKFKSQCEFLTKQLILAEDNVKALQSEVKQLKIAEISRAQHWSTLEMLFSETKIEQPISVDTADKAVQVKCETTDQQTFTEDSQTNASEILAEPASQQPELLTKSSQTPTVDSEVEVDRYAQKSLESQLKQAMALASTRSTLLLETENRLAEYQGRIKTLEKTIEEQENAMKFGKDEQTSSKGAEKTGDNILSITIASLQNLLLEKDTTLSRYQDLLKSERQENSKSYDEFQNQVKLLKSNVSDLESEISAKDEEIQSVKRSLREAEQNIQEAVADITVAPTAEQVLNATDFNEAEHVLAEYYKNDTQNFELKINEQTIEIETLQQRLHESENETRKLQNQLRDASNREKLWEKTINEKEIEIEMMREKLSVGTQQQQQEVFEMNGNREIEQLQETLEERDRHIQDLTDTLSHFHDDQQKFLTDTTLQSAEQVSQLSADLNRCEATNRVMRTQVEALKRQIVNLGLREKQARELVKNLKNQLIRRPVISMKSERIFNSNEDQLQRKVKQLENELTDTREELRKQVSLVEQRRNKNASDLSLWDKQKRWQQTAEKLKVKLSERETEIEKLKSLNGSAKTTIARLEREKHILEQRIRGMRCCQSTSCPNLDKAGSKYTPAESPAESYSTTSDSDLMRDGSSRNSVRNKQHQQFPENREMIESLKARVEAQQRRIIAMELEGKGSNAITHELEKLHERLSSLEAQNIRLEAKNLQLQLDSDITRQTDAASERMKRQIKHMEEYIEVLKNELAQSFAKNLTKEAGNASSDLKSTTTSPFTHGQLEQTILALRRVIEKLKVENKNLKDGKKSPNSDKNGKPTTPPIAREAFNKLKNDYEKCQQLRLEALEEISALKIELELQQGSAVCLTCQKEGESPDSADLESEKDVDDAMKPIKDKLIQKTQLLEKAKQLLTRAAAKEKNLKEQIKFLRRRCSELQNVPVIDECSDESI